MLVGRVKVGRANDQDLHFAAGPMANAGRDQNGIHWFYFHRAAIEFNDGVVIALEHDVNLGVFAVVMLFGVTSDLGQVDSAGKLIAVREGSTGSSAGARDRRQGIQINDLGSDIHSIAKLVGGWLLHTARAEIGCLPQFIPVAPNPPRARPGDCETKAK